MYDVIIIGGGPAGSTSATTLALKGLNVLLLEKEKFPREHVGESLIPLSYASLEKQGLIEDLKKISTRKPGVHFVSGDGIKQSLWCFKNVIKDESYLTFHVIRSAFDKLLLDNSKKNGAHVLEEVQVKEANLENSDGTVTVKAINSKKEELTFHSKFLVDASGQSTFLAKKLGIKKSYDDLDRVATWCHWTNNNFDSHLKEGVIKIIYLGGEKKGWLWVIPVAKDHLSVGIVLNNSYVKGQKQKFKDSDNWKHDMYIQELKESFLFDSILKDSKMEHKVAMAGDYSYYCEKKYGNNFALIGDAGAFLDPIFSSGIYVGMHSAELTAEAIYKKIKNAPDADQSMLEAYAEINGALKLLEKFIRLFYTPEALNFSTLGDPGDLLLYEKFESAYTIFHYLLAGDFFKNHEKYSEFIDVIKDQKSLVKFQNLINHNKDIRPEASCGENFENMYGDMTHQIEFDHTAFE